MERIFPQPIQEALERAETAARAPAYACTRAGEIPARGAGSIATSPGTRLPQGAATILGARAAGGDGGTTRGGMRGGFAGRVCEVRLRCGGKIAVLGTRGRAYLGPGGVTERRSEALTATTADLKYVLDKVSAHSLYSVNEHLKRGFLTYRGCRVGVCGSGVVEGGRIVTIRDISSLVVRFAHDVDCAAVVLPALLDGERVRPTLIFSPPGCGKTTLLRDLAKKLAYRDRPSHIVVLDERAEIGGFGLEECDVLVGLDKAEGFEFAVRNLDPDAGLCDEIKSDEDAFAVEEAAFCGVAVIASVHAASAAELAQKPFLGRLLEKRVFERFVRLSARRGLGTLEEILDGEFRPLTGGRL